MLFCLRGKTFILNSLFQFFDVHRTDFIHSRISEDRYNMVFKVSGHIFFRRLTRHMHGQETMRSLFESGDITRSHKVIILYML